MTRSATPQNEAYLLDIARHGTAQHVAMLLRKYKRTHRQVQGQQAGHTGAHDNSLYQSREFNWRYDEDGMMVINGRLTPEDGALFLNAFNAVFCQMDSSDASTEQKNVSAETFSEEAPAQESVAKFAKHVSAETLSRDEDRDSARHVTVETCLDDTGPTVTQRRADALVLMAEHTLQTLHTGINPMAPGDRQQIVIHIERDSLLAGSGDAAHIEHGPFLSPVTARRLACDAGLVTVLEDDQGNVLNVGRRTRSIPPAQRRALNIRDKGCRFPGCCESRFVDAHHIHHWCDGGETSMNNLVLLCRRHHRLVHEQGFTIVNPGGGEFEFTRPSGTKLLAAVFPQFSDVEESNLESLAIERQHQSMGVVVDAQTACSEWAGERMDYGLAVGVLQDLGELGCSDSVVEF